MKKERKYKDIRRLQMTTHFTEEQLKMLYVQFEKMCVEGHEGDVIEYKQFRKIMRKVLPQMFVSDQVVGSEGTDREGSGEVFCKKLFDLFNLDGTGKLNFRELMSGLNVFFDGTPEEKIQLAFRLYDFGM